ncbi:MAG: carboxypeptidase regulatory-like domain-containing protein [Vicinamibacterales bacterium]
MKRLLAIVALATLCAVPAVAQITQGRLAGTVTDAQGAVLPGVTVTATSPSLIGTQTSVTEADGKFRFPSLPTGTYKLQFELSGFQTVVRENLQVTLGQTISVDTQMPLAQLNETITVSGDAPVIDTTTTKIGTSLKGEALVDVPNSTDVWGALSEAPGLRMQGFDVGGSHKSQQSGYESFGIQNQARVISDGVDHTEGVGGTGFYEDYYANEEVSVSALGADVEMNSGGAAIVTTIKSGGNTFKGLYNFTYEPGSFVGSNAAPSDISSRGYTCPPDSTGKPSCANPNLIFWEGHADLGGPIKKDTAWFYGAYNHFKIDKIVSGRPEQFSDLGIFDNYTGKTTWKPSQNNTVIGYFQQGRKQKPRRGISSLVSPESVRAQDSYSRMYKGEWQRVLTNRAFFNVNVGNFTLDWPMVVQVDPAVNPPRTFRGSGLVTGAGWIAFTTARKKPQAKAQLTYYLPEKAGSHDFKFGFENILDSYRYGHNGRSGPIRYSYPCAAPGGCAPDRIRFIDTGAADDYGKGWTVGPNTDFHYAGYAQDRWSPNRNVTLTLGLRFDYQKVGYGDAIRKPVIQDIAPDGNRIFPASTNVTGKTILSNMNIAPRLGLTYDLTGKGKVVLKGFYGRYYNNLADGFSAINPGGISVAEYAFLDQNGNQRYDGPSELGALRLRTGADNTPVNPDFKTPYTEEISGTAEIQLPGESSARFSYVRKNHRDFASFYGTNLVSAWVGRVTVPTQQVFTYNGQVLNLFDVPDSIANQTDTEYNNYPDGVFHYDTIEAAYTKRLHNFFVQTSFDFQWRDDLRDASSAINQTSPLTADPISIGFYFTPNAAAPNRQKTTVWHYQFLGRYTLKGDVGIAANWRVQSGFQYSPIIPDGATNPGLNLSNFGAPFFLQNLSENRSDTVSLLNLRLDKTFKIGKYSVQGMLDIYNLLNVDAVTNFALAAGPSYKTVVAVLDPRVFQAGIRFEF